MSGEIGVVIPVHNGALHLAEALDSVLAQTLAPAAIVVVDDGSTDATPAVAARYGDRITYCRQDHAGASAARNRGVSRLATAAVAFLDADDLWHPGKLARQWGELAQNDAPRMIFGHVVQFASPELSTEDVARLRFSAAPAPAIHPSALLMWADDFRRVGPFDESLQTGEFIEWYGRAQQAGFASVVLPEVVMRRRLHRSNHGRVRADLCAQYTRALKSTLDRRRRTP